MYLRLGYIYYGEQTKSSPYEENLRQTPNTANIVEFFSPRISA